MVWQKFEIMDSEFEIKTEIEIEDWKPPDVSGTSNQNPSLHSHLNELENINDFLPSSKGLMAKLELKNLNDFLNTSKSPVIKLEGLYFMIR